MWFLQLVSPTGFSTFETLGNISGSNLTVFGLDHRGAFQVLIFPSLCVGVVYCREPYFSLYSVDPVISPAVNHCLHPGRPGDAQRISSFSFLAAASGSQSLSNLLLLHPDRVPLKLLFKKKKDVFLKLFKGSSKSFFFLFSKVRFCLGQTSSLCLRGFMSALYCEINPSTY